MTIPSVYPEWATDDVEDPTYHTPNKLEPDSLHKSNGYSPLELPDRQNINYQFNLIDKWIEYFDSERFIIKTGTTDLSLFQTDIIYDSGLTMLNTLTLGVKILPTGLTWQTLYWGQGIAYPYWMQGIDRISIVHSDNDLKNVPYQVVIMKIAELLT
jgi:hypothetical protein